MWPRGIPSWLNVPMPEIRGVFFNALNLSEHGIAMIPHPRWGSTLDWRKYKKENHFTMF